MRRCRTLHIILSAVHRAQCFTFQGLHDWLPEYKNLLVVPRQRWMCEIDCCTCESPGRFMMPR